MKPTARPLWLYALTLIFACAIVSFAATAVGGFKGYVSPGRVVGFWIANLVAAVIGYLSLRFLSEAERVRRKWEPLVLMGVFWVVAAIVAPVLASARVAATRSTCLSNSKQNALALLIYATEFDDRLPLGSTWQSETECFRRSEVAELRCPDGKTEYSYALNQAVSGLKLEDFERSDTVMAFECDAFLPNPSGGKEWFVARHSGSGAVGRVDGSAKLVKPGDADVAWKP